MLGCILTAFDDVMALVGAAVKCRDACGREIHYIENAMMTVVAARMLALRTIGDFTAVSEGLVK